MGLSASGVSRWQLDCLACVSFSDTNSVGSATACVPSQLGRQLGRRLGISTNKRHRIENIIWSEMKVVKNKLFHTTSVIICIYLYTSVCIKRKAIRIHTYVHTYS